MINLKLFKKNPDQIKNKILEKDPFFKVDTLFSLLKKNNQIIFEISQLQEKINKLSELFLDKSTNIQSIKDEVKLIKIIIQEKNNALALIEEEFNSLLLSCPNITQDNIPIGGKESNQVVKTVGSIPEFNFPIQNHLQLLEKHCGSDIVFGSKVAKSGFFAYKDKLAWLIYRLAMICLKHNQKYGFTVIHIPQLANVNTV